jgi:hypothetical protein
MSKYSAFVNHQKKLREFSIKFLTKKLQISLELFYNIYKKNAQSQSRRLSGLRSFLLGTQSGL